MQNSEHTFNFGVHMGATWKSVNRMLSSAANGSATKVGNEHPVVADFLSALSGDLNISAALAVVHTWMGQVKIYSRM